MDRERWRIMEGLFHEASALPPEKRSTYLEAAASTDSSLRADVEALLRAEPGASARIGRILDCAWLAYRRSRSAPHAP